MSSFFYTLWERANNAPGNTWHWFDTLNREEWLVVLAVVCAAGFASLMGFRSQRL